MDSPTNPPEPTYHEIDALRAAGLLASWWPGGLDYNHCWRVFKVANPSPDELADGTSWIHNQDGDDIPCERSLFIGNCSFGWCVDLADFMGPGRCRYFDSLEDAASFVVAFMFDRLEPQWESRRLHA